MPPSSVLPASPEIAKATLKHLPGNSAKFRAIVLRVQVALHLKGYFSEPFDGLMHARTMAAIYDYQSKHGLEPIVPAVMERWFAPDFRVRRPEVVRAYEEMLRSTTPEGYAMGCDVLADADVRDDLAAITAPTLVIGGAEDPATPPRDQRAIAHAIPHARLEILPSVGHLAPAAVPETIAKLVLDNAERSV